MVKMAISFSILLQTLEDLNFEHFFTSYLIYFLILLENFENFLSTTGANVLYGLYNVCRAFTCPKQSNELRGDLKIKKWEKF